MKNRILSLEQVERALIKSLQPDGIKNVKNFDHIKESFEKHGIAQAWTGWRDEDGTIWCIDGHTRNSVLDDMPNAPKMVPVMFVDADSKEDAVLILLEVYNQTHNKMDNPTLVEWLEVEGIDVELVSVESLDIEVDKSVTIDTTNIDDDNYDLGGLGMDVDVVLNDLITFEQDGEVRHTILCASSLETDSWAKALGEETQLDMIVTDPPYNVDYVGKGKDALVIQNDSMSDDSFYSFLYDFYTSANAYLKKGGAWYVWHSSSEAVNFIKAYIDAGILYKQQLIWVKNSFVMSRQDFHWQHEPCLYGWKEGAAHNWYLDRKQTTLLQFDRPTVNAEHPTMKPIPLIAYQIECSSTIDEIVGDGFGGSCTTALAAHGLGRRSVIIELDPKYCQVGINRMHKLAPDLVIKINGEIYTPKEDGQSED